MRLSIGSEEKKICNKRLQFSGRERKVQMKIQSDNCLLREQAKVKPAIQEVGNEKERSK